MADIYGMIEREYEEDRDEAVHILEAKKKKLYEKEPRLREIEKELGKAGIALAKIFAFGGDKQAEMQKYQAFCENLQSERKQLLNKYNLPENYLELSYKCADCRDTGFVDGVRCHCYNKRLTNHYYDMSNVREIIKTENFDSFNFNIFSSEGNPSPRRKISEIFTECISAIEKINAEPMNMFFYGGTGLGKTFMCNCIAKAMLDKSKNVIYMTAYDLTELLIGAHFANNDEALDDKVRLIRACDMLIIDDLGTEMINTASNTELFNVINSRLNNKLSTVISTNRSITELYDAYSERIVSRLLGKYKVCEFIGRDLRLYS